MPGESCEEVDGRFREKRRVHVDDAAPSTSVSEPLGRTAHRLVLFADDEDLIRRLGRAILERAGYEVELACDGEEAVALFEAKPERFDAVVLDTMMPRLRGDVAAERIRSVRADVPIICTSGYSDTSTSLEHVVVLPKPYSPEALLGALSRALG